MTKNKTDFSKLKVGDSLGENQFYKVEVITKDEVQLKPESGESVVYGKDYVEQFLTSAGQSVSEVKLSRTDLIKKVESSVNVVSTVNYNKKVEPEDVLKEILDTHLNTAPANVEKAFKATVKKALEGEPRTLVGRFTGSVDEFGRLRFIDMNADTSKSTPNYDSRLRLVDPRTLQWFIVENIKYSVK